MEDRLGDQLAELGMGSIVPASGAGGLAFGAWILHEGGMSADRIARRSVAFFLIKSSVNFVAVAVLGIALFAGLLGPEFSPWLTIAPAIGAVLALVAVPTVGRRLAPGEPAAPGAGRVGRAWAAARKALVGGTAEAVEILRSRDPLLLIGAVGCSRSRAASGGFWLPLVVGAISFASLRRGLNHPDRPDLCAVPAAG